MTSSAVSQIVSDLSLDIATGGSSTATVSAGGTATYHLTIGPTAGTTHPAAITLSATGGPTGSTISITPQNIAAGAGATAVTVAIQVPAARAAVHSSHGWVLAAAFPFMGMLALPFGIERRRGSFKRALLAVLLFVGLVSTAALLGCGGGTGTTPPPKQPTNYTITVTATSGSISHSTNLTLTVQ